MAWHYLPIQLSLVVLLSLLVGYIAWLATTYRVSFPREINLDLAQHEFELFCQPLLNTHSQQCAGIEILLCWSSSCQGWISPDMFIPIVEEHHLIVPLTRYVIAETIRQRHAFPMSSRFHVDINVAPGHSRRGVLIKDLNQYWFSAHPIRQLILGTTERDALLDVDCRIARELHRKNVKLAIDDFNIDNSSFSWSETLCPDVPKIGKSSIVAVSFDTVNSTVTDIIIVLGQRLDTELVAESVETWEQAKYLRRHGVHILQGCLYTQPTPLRNFPEWLADSQPPPARYNGYIMPIIPLR